MDDRIHIKSHGEKRKHKNDEHEYTRIHPKIRKKIKVAKKIWPQESCKEIKHKFYKTILT